MDFREMIENCYWPRFRIWNNWFLNYRFGRWAVTIPFLC